MDCENYTQETGCFLENIEHKGEGSQGVLKVSRGSLIVMKGKLKNGLYILQGSTVEGTTAVSSISNTDQSPFVAYEVGSYE